MSPIRAAAGVGWILISGALFCGACSDVPANPPGKPAMMNAAEAGAQRTRERVDSVLFPHAVGTNLPPWAACYFPQRANAYAYRRAAPCPPETQATRTYRVEELMGCWRITAAGGDAVDVAGFAGPVRLLRGPSARMRQRGWTERGLRGVQYAAPMLRTRAMDTLLTVVYWRFAPPDSLTIATSTGLAGAAMTFRLRGDSSIGMLQFYGDVISESTDTASDPVRRLAANRVPCPSPTSPGKP